MVRRGQHGLRHVLATARRAARHATLRLVLHCATSATLLRVVHLVE